MRRNVEFPWILRTFFWTRPALSILALLREQGCANPERGAPRCGRSLLILRGAAGKRAPAPWGWARRRCMGGFGKVTRVAPSTCAPDIRAVSACKQFRVTRAAERGLPTKPLAPLSRDVLDEGAEALPCRSADESEQHSEHHVLLRKAMVLKRGVRKQNGVQKPREIHYSEHHVLLRRAMVLRRGVRRRNGVQKPRKMKHSEHHVLLRRAMVLRRGVHRRNGVQNPQTSPALAKPTPLSGDFAVHRSMTLW